MKECVVCNKEFEAYRSNSITCSEECRKAKRAEYSKQWRKENAETLAIKKSEYQKKHREYITERKKKWRETRRPPKIDIQCKKCKEYFTPTLRNKHITFCSQSCQRQHWVDSSPMVRLSARFRLGIRGVISGRNKKSSVWEYLSFTPEELMSQFESQFTERNGLSWDNMGEWHIDHIRPVASFNFDSTEHPDFKKCWALNNLQPLWAVDNMSKGNKWDGIINA